MRCYDPLFVVESYFNFKIYMILQFFLYIKIVKEKMGGLNATKIPCHKVVKKNLWFFDVMISIVS